MTAQLSPTPIFKGWSNTGLPLSYGLLTTYKAGTTIKQAAYVDSTQTTPLSNPVKLDFRGETPLWLDPTLTYKFVLTDFLGNMIPNYPVDNIPGGFAASALNENLIPGITNTYTIGNSIFSWANIYLGPKNAPALDPITGNIGYYAQTPEETALIALGFNAPIDLFWPPGWVDRYTVNASSGSTPMATAFSTAFQVAGKLGCNTNWGPTAPYLLDGPVNATGIRGVIANDKSSANASFGPASVIIGHTGHAFDLSTSTEITFNNLVATSATGIVPKTLFFCARNTAGSGAGLHRFNNIRTLSNCKFTWLYYGYGSEENAFYGCELYNAQPGSGIASHNATNPAVYTSSFVAIATGTQSNAGHYWTGGNGLFQAGSSGSHNEVNIQLENVLNFTFATGLMYNADGQCYVQILGTTASAYLSFRDIRGEVAGSIPYGFYVTPNNTGVTHTSWSFDNVFSNSSGALLAFLGTNTPSIQNLKMLGCTSVSGIIITAWNMTDSHIESLQDSIVQGQAGGTVTGNIFIGGRNNITLSGAFSGNLYADNFAGGFGVDNDNFTSTVAACIGALTVNAQYQVRLSPNGKQVILTLPQITGTTTAATNFQLGIVLPAQYRPSANLNQPVIIEDNSAIVNQPGKVVITATTGVIQVFKDLVGSGTFTNSATGGLPNLTEIVWNL